jgi:tetratricopeptide (TPR) repeat protein
MAFLLFMGFYINVYYQYSVQPIISAYPEEVHKKLRRALYFADYEKDEKMAIRYFKETLIAADENGMDPLSQEVLGVKFKMASFLEEAGSHRLAIRVLETAKRECLTWNKKWGWKKEPVAREKRSRLLKTAIAISIKVASLYGCEYIQEWDSAEENLVWAVETELKETQRRNTEGLLEGDGEWMTDEQKGANFEGKIAPSTSEDPQLTRTTALAHFYEAKDQYLLATPLFLRALTHCPTNNCHSVTLMNNVATSLAQQPPPDPALVAKTPNFIPLSKQAERWCNKALEVAKAIPEEQKTPECITASSVAMYNLASFAELQGHLEEAEKFYTEARRLAVEAPGEEDQIWDDQYGPRAHKTLRAHFWEWLLGPPPANKRDHERATRSVGSSLAFDAEKAKRIAEGRDDEREAEEERRRNAWGWWVGFTFYPFRETWDKFFPKSEEDQRGYQRGFQEGIEKADEGIARIRKAREAEAQKALVESA